MNREDINKFWSEAYMSGMLLFEQREKFARLVAAAEREACAKICDEAEDRAQTEHAGYPEKVAYYNGQANAAEQCAIAIRARGET